MNDKKKDRPIAVLIALGVGEIIAVFILTLLSYAVEVVPVPDGAAPITKIIAAVAAINNREISFSPSDVFGTLIHGDGTMKKALVLSLAASILCFVYVLKGNGKRFHKKGIEHGSAKWGEQKEKDMIADTTKDGFYNNVIVAADVFLVLDRKQREKNELVQKQEKRRKRKNAIDRSGKKDEAEGQKDKAHAQS